jgi:hypothetical protein
VPDDKQAIYDELERRGELKDPRKQAIVQELARRGEIHLRTAKPAKTASPIPKIPTSPAQTIPDQRGNALTLPVPAPTKAAQPVQAQTRPVAPPKQSVQAQAEALAKQHQIQNRIAARDNPFSFIGQPVAAGLGFVGRQLGHAMEHMPAPDIAAGSGSPFAPVGQAHGTMGSPSQTSPVQRRLDLMSLKKLQEGYPQEAMEMWLDPHGVAATAAPAVQTELDKPAQSHQEAASKAIVRAAFGFTSADNLAIAVALPVAAGQVGTSMAGNVARLAISGYFGVESAKGAVQGFQKYKASGYQDKDALWDGLVSTGLAAFIGKHGLKEVGHINDLHTLQEYVKGGKIAPVRVRQLEKKYGIPSGALDGASRDVAARLLGALHQNIPAKDLKKFHEAEARRQAAVAAKAGQPAPEPAPKVEEKPVSPKAPEKPARSTKAKTTKTAPKAPKPVATAPDANKPETKDKTTAVFRHDDAPDFSKPHGLYTTPVGRESPHSDVGARSEWKLNPNASSIDIPDYGQEVAMRKGAVGAGAGVHAARYFLGPEEFDRLKSLSKAELLAHAASKYPGVDFTKYFDRQEIMEAIGGLEARSRGYDLFHVRDASDPNFDEVVLLNKNAVSESNKQKEKPTNATVEKVRKAGDKQEHIGDGPQRTPTTSRRGSRPKPTAQELQGQKAEEGVAAKKPVVAPTKAVEAPAALAQKAEVAKVALEVLKNKMQAAQSALDALGDNPNKRSKKYQDLNRAYQDASDVYHAQKNITQAHIDHAYSAAPQEPERPNLSPKDRLVLERGQQELHGGIGAVFSKAEWTKFKEAWKETLKNPGLKLAPAMMSKEAGHTARMGRDYLAQLAQSDDQHFAALDKIERAFPEPRFDPVNKLTDAEREEWVDYLIAAAEKRPVVPVPTSEAVKKLMASAVGKQLRKTLVHIHQMETLTPHGDPDMDAHTQTLHGMLAPVYSESLAYTKGIGNDIPGYVSHYWENPKGAKAYYERRAEADLAKREKMRLAEQARPGRATSTRKPLRGSMDFTHQRVYGTTLEGIRAGLRPKTTNPAKLFRMKIHEIQKFIIGNKWFSETRDAGYMKPFRPGAKDIPDDWLKIDDKIAEKYYKETYQTKAGVTKTRYQKGWEYWAPAPVASIFNNYLSEGLRGTGRLPGYDTFLAFSNLLNSYQLGLSGFHASTTALHDTISAVARVGMALQEGRPVKATLAKAGKLALKVPFSPFESYFRGWKGQRVWRGTAGKGIFKGEKVDAHLLATMDLLRAGGTRVTMPKEFRLDAMERFSNAVGFRREGRRWYQGTAHVLDWDKKQALLSVLPATMEAVMAPILRDFVPKVKLGAEMGMASDAIQSEMKRLGRPLTVDEQRKIGAEIVDTADNRYGQIVYQNLFMDNMMKDLGHALLRSPGYTGGTIREYGGAALDVARMPKRLKEGGPPMTRRQAFALSSFIGVGIMGGIYHKMFTGKWPKSFDDFYHPMGAGGHRITMPGYVGNIEKFWRGGLVSMGGWVYGKIAPAPEVMEEVGKNRDYHDKEIAPTGDVLRDPWIVKKQTEAYFWYFGGEFLPFSLRRTGKGTTWYEGLAGITPWDPPGSKKTAVKTSKRGGLPNTLPRMRMP